MLVVTVGYKAPELECKNRVWYGTALDMFSCALVFYELLFPAQGHLLNKQNRHDGDPTESLRELFGLLGTPPCAKLKEAAELCEENSPEQRFLKQASRGISKVRRTCGVLYLCGHDPWCLCVDIVRVCLWLGLGLCCC